ncbi:unnamed protein product, partial [Heterosigma akashiwo]
ARPPGQAAAQRLQRGPEAPGLPGEDHRRREPAGARRPAAAAGLVGPEENSADASLSAGV